MIRQLISEKDAWELLRMVYHEKPRRSDIKRWVLELCASHVGAKEPFYQSCAEMASFILNDNVSKSMAKYHLNRQPREGKRADFRPCLDPD